MPNDIKILKYYLWDQYFLKYHINKRIHLPEHNQAETSIDEFLKSQSNLNKQDLSSTTFTIFDLETTGFFPNMGDEIISIGAIKVKNFQILFDEAFYTIIKPVNKVPKTVQELTGLEPEVLDKAHSFPIGMKKFIDYCKGSILVAHPATFDIDFLSTTINKWQLPHFNPDFLDSHLLANDIYSGERNYLDDLITKFQITERDRHHALNDAVMTAEVFIRLLKHYQKKNVTNVKELQQEFSNYRD
ncbi:DNA polymerase III epsilon subunit family exonuclease [Metabacillus crassostreae]|uniref:3'-5' exonuclease n=1 Tax=Metabacillus crassostreae TaxID=929098 RepID=UPI00195E7B76|nr:exonuclease domain-containing protein [Metabacillus crassostreae]MBM7602230.1 DNA polymerase III epsilon subunit family exonuclease [Metabacillus crassostreae]